MIAPDVQSVAKSLSDYRSEYNLQRDNRWRARRPGVGGVPHNADWHFGSESSWLKGLELARAFDRDDCIVGQGVTRFLDNCVQKGFQLEVDTGDPELDAVLADRWGEFTEHKHTVHEGKRLSWLDLQKLVPRAVIFDGDHFVLPQRESGRIQTVEAHRCRTAARTTKKNVVYGVEVDPETTAPLWYWFTKQDVGPYGRVQFVREVERFEAFDEGGNPAVLHLKRPKRVSQTRGISALAPIADQVGMHDDLQFAKMVQAQLVSAFAILEEVPPEGPQPGGNKKAQTGERETFSRDDGSTRIEQGLSPGVWYRSRPGNKLQGFSPNVPNTEFFQHAMLMLSIISVNLGIPVMLLLLDPTQTNFSGWRGAMDQARIGWESFQQWMVDEFYRPLYRWKVRQFLFDDPVLERRANRDGVNAFGHAWHAPTWPYIEPLKDATADALIVGRHLSSPRRIQKQRGRDWDQVSTEIVDDAGQLLEKAIAKAAEINKAHPDNPVPLTYRDILAPPTDGNLRISVSTAPENPESSDTERGNDAE